MTSLTVNDSLQLTQDELQIVTARARAMWYEAEELAEKGHFRRAVQKAVNGAALFETVGDKTRKARMLGQAGEICHRAHHYRASAYYLWTGLRCLPKGEVAERCWIWGLLARVYRQLWDFSRAEKYNRIQLKISMEQNNAAQTAYAHFGLGINDFYQGQWKSSLAHSMKALEISKSLGDRRIEFMANLAIACVYNATGDFESARPILVSLLSPEAALGDSESICLAYEELSRLHIGTRDWDQFQEARDKTAEWASKSKSLANVGRAVMLDAEYYWAQGQRKKAIRSARRAIAAFRSNGAVAALHEAERKLLAWLKGENLQSESVEKARSRPDSSSRSAKPGRQTSLSR
ncbi:MAG: hypothetical protein ACYC53_02055 [Bacillota bacterium]